MERILVITSNAQDRWLLEAEGLSALRAFAVAASTWAAAVEILDHELITLVLADFGGGAADLEQLGRLHSRFPDLPLIAMTDDHSAQAAITAFRLGAADYLIRPFGSSELTDSLTRARRRERQAPTARTEAVEAEKLAALELVVAGVAHELNNPLACVVGYSQLLLRDQQLPRSVRSDVERILEQSKLAAHVVQGLLSFGQQTAASCTALSMTQLVERALELPAAALPPTVAVERQLAIGMPTVWGDPYLLQQMMLQMVGNARTAMGANGGTLRISTYQVDDVADFIADHEGTQPLTPLGGPAIITEVADTGAQTAGLGLAVCQQIAEQHAGAFWAVSRAGQGTRVYAALPPRRRR